MMRRLLLMIAVTAALSAPALGQSPRDGMDACGEQRNDAVRLACFDRELARRRAAPEVTAPPAATAAPAVPATPAVILAPVARSAPPAVAKPQATSGTVASVADRGTNLHAITLADGQVWEQTQPFLGFVLSPGDAVTITPGFMGAFFLSSSHHQTFRVKRML